jgi:hypothetical protein
MVQFKGNNSLSAKNMFVNRKVYNSYILTLLEDISLPTLESQQIKDFQQDEKMLYGRIDQTIKDAVFPRNDYLKTFQNGPQVDGLTAVNFVVDAFTEMKYKFDRDLRNGSISPDSQALSDLSVFKAYESPIRQYDIHTENMISSFRNYVIKNRLVDKISSFDSFIPIFMDFAKVISPSVPITRTLFFLSRFISPRVSGLVVEIYDGDYGDDTIKADLFYSDRNFEYLKNLAYVFGFMIDKHIPWRLVADLNSPRMQSFMSATFRTPDMNANKVLPLVFARSYPDDITTIINLVVSCYNAIAQYRPKSVITGVAPTIGQHSSRTSFDQGCRTVKTIYRNPVSVDYIAGSYPSDFWLSMYADIRNIETGLNYEPLILREIKERAADLQKSLDFSVGLEYINTKFDNVEHFAGSLFHDVTRLEMAEDPEATEDSVSERVLRSVQASNFVIY